MTTKAGIKSIGLRPGLFESKASVSATHSKVASVSDAGSGKLGRVAAISASVLALGALILLILEIRASDERWSAVEANARITKELPPGSAAEAIRAYLRSQGISYDEFVVSDDDSMTTFLRRSQIEPGTNVIWAQRRQDNSIIGLGPRMLELIFTLTDGNLLDEVFIYAHDPL